MNSLMLCPVWILRISMQGQTENTILIRNSAKFWEKIEKSLGKRGLENMHMHITGIAYGEKGEKHHLNLKESDLKYKELLKALKDFKVNGVAISESPNIEED